MPVTTFRSAPAQASESPPLTSSARDSRLANDLSSNHYEGGIYWREAIGPFRAWARGTFGTISFDSKREVRATTPLRHLRRTANGQWKGRDRLGDGRARPTSSQAGRFSVRPTLARILQAERGRLFGDRRRRRVRLTIRDRSSNESAANAMLALGYDFDRPEPDLRAGSGWSEGRKRREILGGSVATRSRRSGTARPSRSNLSSAKSGWRGGLRLLRGSSVAASAAKVKCEGGRRAGCRSARGLSDAGHVTLERYGAEPRPPVVRRTDGTT